MISNIIKPVILLILIFINITQFRTYYNSYIKQDDILHKIFLGFVCVAIMLSMYYIMIGLVIQAKVILLEVGDI